MRLNFIGADHEVTGSCHFLQACGKNLLIDCGMEQGTDEFENQPIPVAESEIDYILLTHAHIDHTGLLPLFYARGFRGQVFTTKATTELCRIMLKDCAHIQMFEAEWKNRKAKRSGGQAIEPLYDMEDALGAIELFCPCEYNQMVTLCDGIRIRFSDVGHLLGSASIEVWANEEGLDKKIVFSGDIGNINQPLIRDPQYLTEADYVVMESTYGNRSHGKTPDYVRELAEVIRRTFNRGGNVVIPAFAVGRTQEILYFLRKIKVDHMIQGHEDFEVYVDSPLAIEATNIFTHNKESCFDEEAMELVKQGINPISFPGLKVAVTSDESKNINFDMKPKVIISASGMCEAGRIRHHLKHNLWRQECSILFVGYQAVGTLGRSLLEGAKTARLFGETIEVRADIVKMDGISGHADKEGLLRWVCAFGKKPEKVFVVHGEDSVTSEFAQCLAEEYGMDAVAPYSGAVYDLADGSLIKEGNMVHKAKKAAAKKANAVFERLAAAGKRLMHLIMQSEGMANKDLAKFADQVTSLCDKWER